MGESDMMYGQYYGKYERGEWLPEHPRCPYCENETTEFLRSTLTHEVIGCRRCTSTKPSWDEQYMVDTDEGLFLQCPRCESLCETLYADKKSTYWVDGCDECMEWIDSYYDEEDGY